MSAVLKPLPVAGVATVKGRPDSKFGRLHDIDRAMIVAGDSFTPWSGNRRRGMKCYKSAILGPGTRLDQFDYARKGFLILRTPQADTNQNDGHNIVIVDTVGAQAGRPVAAAHHSGGLKSHQIVSEPWFDGEGLDDLSTSGAFTGLNPLVIVVEIDAEGTPDTFRISLDGGTTWAASGVSITGAWQDIGSAAGGSANGALIKFTATTGHADGDRWKLTLGARPGIAGYLHRMSPHTYPMFAGGQGKTYICAPFNRILVDDGVKVREAGIEAPHIRPRIIADIGSTTDLGDTDNASIQWFVTAGATDVAVTQISDPATPPDPGPAAGTKCIRIEIPKTNSGRDVRRGSVDLAKRNIGGGGTVIAPETKRLRVWLYARLKRGKIEKNKLSLVFADAADLGGNRIVVKIGQAIPRNQWFQADVPWPTRETDFTALSVGLRLEGSIDKNRFDSSSKAYIYLDDLTKDAVTTGVSTAEASADLFAGNAEWYLRFAWMRDGRIGSLSPWTEPLRLDGTAIKADLSGDYPGIQDGLRNAPPPGCDRVMIYLATSSSGGDPRLGGQGLSFFRFSPPEGTPISDLESPTTGQLVLTLTDEQQKGFMLSIRNERDPFYHAQPAPGTLCLQDGSYVLSGAHPAYAVGQWEWADGSNIIVPVDSGEAETTPVVGKWMEGRRIVREGEGVIYRILKALDTDADGILDALYIGRVFNAEQQELEGGYEGTSGDGAATILAERKLWATNVSEDEGADIENASLLQEIDPLPSGDFPRAAFKTGETVWILGRQNAGLLRLNPSALANEPVASGVPYSNPIHVPGIGLAGPRAFAQRADGTVWGITPRGELYVFGGEGAQKHPASDVLAGILSGRGFLTETEDLEFSWAVEEKPDAEHELIRLHLVSARSSTGEPGVTITIVAGNEFDTTEEIPPTTFDPDTFEYDTPWPVDDADFWATGEGENMPMVHVEAWDPAPGRGAEPWSGPTDAGGLRGWWAGASGDYDADLDTSNASDVSTSITSTGPGTDNPEQADCTNAAWPGSAYHSYSFGVQIDANSGPLYYYARSIVLDSVGVGPLAEYFHNSLFDEEGLAGHPERCRRVIAAPYLAHYIYVKGEAGTIPAGTFRWRFRYWPDNPGVPSANPSDGPPDPEFDRLAVIDQAITMNEWTLVVMPTPDWNSDEAWTNKDEELQPGILHDRVVLELVAEINGALFTPSEVPEDPGTLTIYVSGGRQISGFEGDEDTESTPVDPFDPTACIDRATEYKTGALEADFELCLLIDMKSGEVFPGSECPFTCRVQQPPSGCAPSGTLAGPLFLCDKQGFIREVADHLLMDGNPQTRFIFDAAASPGGMNTFNIGGPVWATGEPLHFDIDGDSQLVGLVAVKLNPTRRTAEFRRITAQGSATQITVAPNWTHAPAAGDQIMIAPLPMGLVWPASTTRRGSRFTSAAIDIQRAETTASNPATTAAFDPPIIYRAYRGPGPSNVCDFSAPVVERVYRASDFDQGDGRVGLPVEDAKAIAPGFIIIQGQESRIVVGGFEVGQIFSDPGEAR